VARRYEAAWPLPLEQVDYRVRYCASGLDAAQEQDTRMAGQPAVDRYLLQFWPQSPEPDAVIRQTCEFAGYWHEQARTRPAPPKPEQRAEARRRQQLAREQAVAQAARLLEERRWGDRLPDERVRGVNGALPLAGLDRELLDALETLDDRTQRAIAVWAARRAYTVAGWKRSSMSWSPSAASTGSCWPKSGAHSRSSPATTEPR